MNGLLDLTSSPSFLRIAGIILGISAVVLWVSLVIWTFRDIRSRSRDILVAIISSLLVLILNIPGLLIYLLLRPGETLNEKYEKALEEEALLKEIKSILRCPQCSLIVQSDFLFCPVCQQRLKKKCLHCQSLLAPEWEYCPYCEARQNSPQV